MKISSVKKYLCRMRREISPITDKKYRILFLYIDFIYCYFKYGTVLDQYVRGHFFELSKGQRKKSVKPQLRRNSLIY